MSMYRTPIVTGDRVALAPHTDQWMEGLRFGTVESIYISHDGFLRYDVRLTPQRVMIAKHDDLLGAVAGTPVGGTGPRYTIPIHDESGSIGAIRSTEPSVAEVEQVLDRDDDGLTLRQWLKGGWRP